MKLFTQLRIHLIVKHTCIIFLYHIFTKPNSLLLIKSNSVLHKVSKLTSGERSIFKIIYTQSDIVNNNYHNQLLRFI